MPIQGLFHENEAAIPYRSTIPTSFSEALTPDGIATGGYDFVIGWGDGAKNVSGSILDTHNPGAFPVDGWSYTVTWPAGWGGGGTFSNTGSGTCPTLEIDWGNTTLATDGACNAVFDISQFVLKEGGVAKVTLGAQNDTFGAYDRRLNSEQGGAAGGPIGIPIVTGEPNPGCGSDYASMTPHNYNVTGTINVGTEYFISGAWHSDAASIDNALGAPGIACACPRALPDIGGTTCADVSASFEYIDVLTKTVTGAIAGDCDGIHYVGITWEADQLGHYYTESFTAEPSTSGISVLRKHSDAYCNTVVPFGGETNYDPPDTSSGTTYVTYSKTVYNWHGHSYCSQGVPCAPAPPPPSFCGYTAHAIESWPVKPPCSTLKALAYDVSKYLRHTRVTGNAATSTLWLGVSDNANPGTWLDLDTGIAATQARVRFEDEGSLPRIGILYPSGANLKFIRTPDEGKTFGAPMTITALLAAGGFSDYDEGANGLRHFYWQQGAGPYTIYYMVFDRQLNVVRAAAATNITNADLAPIAVRESWQEGAWRMGIEYTSSGSVLWKQAPDGTTFT